MEAITPLHLQGRVPQFLHLRNSPSVQSFSSDSSHGSPRSLSFTLDRSPHFKADSVVHVLGGGHIFSCSTTPSSTTKSLKHTKSLSMDAAPFVPLRHRHGFRDLSLDNTQYTQTMPMVDVPFHRHYSDHIPDRPRVSSSRFHKFQTLLNQDISFPLTRNPVSHSLDKAQTSLQTESNGGLSQAMYDPYVTPPSSMATPSQPPQINPYAQEPNSTGSASYYQNSSFAQPIQYHLYTSLGPHREALLPYQRTAHDFFIPDALREDLQRKSATTLQTLPSK